MEHLLFTGFMNEMIWIIAAAHVAGVVIGITLMLIAADDMMMRDWD